MMSHRFAWIMLVGLSALVLGCATTSKSARKSPSSDDRAGAEYVPEDGQAPDADRAVQGDEGPQPMADDSGGPPEKRTLEVIGKIVKDNRQMVRDCYNQARKKDPSLQGNLTIHFVLDPDGDVMSAELNRERSDITTPAVVECAIMLIKALKFPPSSRGMETVVNYPFNLQPH
ncbi:MAG: AgmX/PglI C-terminal domain-containing protein [Polyangiaceae bacterium]|nr:AgmX/PglI C-terminal domain-containing protein [Polyangiaceae bacterium]